MKRKTLPKTAKRAASFVLAFVLSLSLLAVSAFADEFASGYADGNHASANQDQPDQLDYIAAKYEILDHVFDVITLDRLNLILQGENEKSIFILADASSETAKAAIPAINAKAQSLGIEKIYYFDLILAGEYGVNIWDNPEETWPDTTTVDGIPVSQDFITVKKVLQGASALGGIPDSYVAANDVFLFVSENNKIVKSTLIQSADNLQEASVNDTLSSVIVNGQSVATVYTQFDYFNSDIWKSNANKAYYTDFSEFEDNFKLRAITYYELIYLLENIEGDHNIFISGSWCGDSKLALPFVIENSSKYNSSTVYVFDFRITQGFNQAWAYKDYMEAEFGSNALSGISIIADEGVDRVTGITHLGAKIMDLFGENFPVGVINAQRQYVVDGNLSLNENGTVDVEYATTPSKSFRSPYLAVYNKDAPGDVKITKAWLHTVTETDINYVGQEWSIGDLVDYELNSGSFSNQQIAYGRYECALFFGAQDVSYVPSVPTISENSAGVDSGCGDENDVMNDLGQETLIPNHGSTLYDVAKYDIDVTLVEDEGGKASAATFDSTTVITATALEDLEGQIILDFRNISIDDGGITVTEKATGTALTGISYQQINDDEQDMQKLIINFDGTISKDSEFEVSVSYKVLTVDYSVENLGSPQGFNVHVDGQGYTVAGEPFGATYWFPCNNTPVDGAQYKITLHAPIGYTLVSNGVRTSNVAAGADGLAAATWEVTQDTAAYQIFATFSKNLIELKQETGEEKEGYYTTADGREIPIYAYVNKTIYDDVDNRYKADRYYALLPYYISTLEDMFGAYPGEALGFVFEDVGNGTGGSASWGAIETKDRPFYTASGIVNENTFVHEFAHQWFGDAVRLPNWNELWLNEGFATFATDLYYEFLGTEFTVNGETQVFTTTAKYRALWESKDADSILWETAVANIDRESKLFGGAKIPYTKGALALAVLREGIGDETFFSLLQAWVESNQGQSKTTDDFVALAEEISGKDLSEYAATWLYGIGKPTAFTLSGQSEDVASGDSDNAPSSSSADGSGENSAVWIAVVVIVIVVVIIAVVVAVIVVKKKKTTVKSSKK